MTQFPQEFPQLISRFFSVFPTLAVHRVTQAKQRLNGEISMELHFEFKSHQNKKEKTKKKPPN